MIIIKLFSGHKFVEPTDIITTEFLNKMIENGRAVIQNLPIGVSDGGTGGTDASSASGRTSGPSSRGDACPVTARRERPRGSTGNRPASIGPFSTAPSAPARRGRADSSGISSDATRADRGITLRRAVSPGPCRRWTKASPPTSG